MYIVVHTRWAEGEPEDILAWILPLLDSFANPNRDQVGCLCPTHFVFSVPRFSGVSKSFEWRKIISFYSLFYGFQIQFDMVILLCLCSACVRCRAGGGIRDVYVAISSNIIFMVNKNKKATNNSMRMAVRACSAAFFVYFSTQHVEHCV